MDWRDRSASGMADLRRMVKTADVVGHVVCTPFGSD